MIPERRAGPRGWRPCVNCGAVASIPPGGGPFVFCEDDGPDAALLVELADRLLGFLDGEAEDAAAVVNLDDLARLQGQGSGPVG